MTSIDVDQMAAVCGGMKWENFRRSTNIEDRRPPEAVAQDNAWFKSLGSTPPSDKQILEQWVRRADNLQGGAK